MFSPCEVYVLRKATLGQRRICGIMHFCSTQVCLFLATYFLQPDGFGGPLIAYLPALDRAGSILLVVGSVLTLGWFLRIKYLGPVEMLGKSFNSFCRRPRAFDPLQR